MNDAQTSLVCGISGCDMTFTNDAELNSHHKKHDMFLNLGLVSKASDIDQTPTPTRFIRNCEEVGLFQDLQNVNPFDETFKKAIEASKLETLHVPADSTDDTLHTPHIFPPVDGNFTNFDSHSENNDNQSSDFCIAAVPSIQENPPSNDICTTDEHDLIIDLESNEVSSSEKNNSDMSMLSVKNKLKQVITNKDKTNNIKAIPLKEPKPVEKVALRKDSQNIKTLQKIEKIRRINREAAGRLRQRKKNQLKDMKSDLENLRKENTRLTSENSKLCWENQSLKHKLATIKNLIEKEKCKEGNKDLNCLNIIEQLAVAPMIQLINTNNTNLPKSTTKRVLPIRKKEPNDSTSTLRVQCLQQQQIQVPSQPVLIQIMGSVTQMSMQQLPHQR